MWAIGRAGMEETQTIIERSSIISGVKLVGRVPNQGRAGTLPDPCDPCDISALAIVWRPRHPPEAYDSRPKKRQADQK